METNGRVIYLERRNTELVNENRRLRDCLNEVARLTEAARLKPEPARFPVNYEDSVCEHPQGE